MARESTEQLIRHYYEVFNSGDRPALLEVLSDDVIHEINEGGIETGRETFRVFLERMDRSYREQVVDLIVMADASGTRASAEFYIEGVYLVSDEGLPEAKGQTYRLRVGAFFEVEAGKIRRVTNYYNLREWIAQVNAA